MNSDDRTIDDWLLDSQLERLSEDERRELADKLRRDPALADRHSELQRVLEPLDAWNVRQPPASLADKVLDRIADYDDGLPVVRACDLDSASGGARGRIFSFRELLTAAAVIGFLLLILVPSLSNIRARSQRVACAANLGVIGRAVQGYALANSNVLPMVPASADSRWLFGGSPQRPYAPNSRSRFLVLRLGYIAEPKVFTCPSASDAVPMNMANPQAVSDFPDPRNCSYDSLNMAGPTPKLNGQCSLPYMADANPMFAGGKFHDVDPTLTNSPNHRGHGGQNVLCLDGQVNWFTSPNCGLRGDNIWQAGSLRIYRGTELQTSERDTFLVP
jgi:hypothetical protein